MTHSKAWLEIHADRLLRNYHKIAKFAEPCEVMAVLKADAYGLGVANIAPLIAEAGAKCIGVAEVAKALKIKDLGVPIHILGGLVSEEVQIVVEEGFVAPITDLASAEALSAEAVRQGKTIQAHVNIDTGMGRLGVMLTDAANIVPRIKELPGLDLCGIFSHFPFAYGDRDFSLAQISAFKDLLTSLESMGITFDSVHIANSDGMNNLPEAMRSPFNMVRTGINLYGAFDPDGKRALDLEEIFEFKSQLVAVRDLPAGHPVGYGCMYRTPKPMRVGTVAVGYADGLPFGMPGKAFFMVDGIRCPVIGRISMDFTTISLEGVPSAKQGDLVLCLGDDITVEDWAFLRGTVSYEVLCSFGTRVERKVVS